jgi:hypothetical protein
MDKKIVDIVDIIFLEKNYCKVELKENGFLIFDKKGLAVGEVEKRDYFLTRKK